MKRVSWYIVFSFVLVALSALLYFIHYAIFKDTYHMFYYMLSDIAFVPIEVLLVAIILHRLLNYREKRTMLNKLNMVIGAFFSEVGSDLLKSFSGFDKDLESLRKHLLINKDWNQRHFLGITKGLKTREYSVDSKKGNLENLRSLLVGKRIFLLGLLENPNLLEHESFTELLWAVFHLTEELSKRGDLRKLPEPDYEHLSGDIKRAYTLLTSQWLGYMSHLKEKYPYLYSLAVRTNPFDLNASVELK